MEFGFCGTTHPYIRPKYVLVIVQYFITWIELVALLQNSFELATAAFLDHGLAQFVAHIEVFTNQGKTFPGSF